MSTANKIPAQYLTAGHWIAIAFAIGGLTLIVAAPLDSIVYGVVLFLFAIGLDIVVAVHCHDSHHTYRRRVSSSRSRALRARKR